MNDCRIDNRKGKRDPGAHSSATTKNPGRLTASTRIPAENHVQLLRQAREWLLGRGKGGAINV